MKSLENKISWSMLTEEQRQWAIEMYASALNDIKESREILNGSHNPIDIELHTFHNGLNKGTIAALLTLFGREPFENIDV